MCCNRMLRALTACCEGLAPRLVLPAQADIFSLGIVLFELFLRKTMAALIMEAEYDPGLVGDVCL